MEDSRHIAAYCMLYVSHRLAGFLSGSFSLGHRRDKLWDQSL
jgi:hypothetical protein